MNYLEKFYDAVKKEMTAVLATSAEGSVTMRVVSPVYYEGDILIFTSAGSRKYNQLKENPNCCISAGCCFAEAAAEFFGGTMLDENQNMRDAYTEKFPEAFDESVEFGGRYAEWIYDAKAEYNKRQRAVKKEKQIEYNIAFYSRLADQYDAEKATA